MARYIRTLASARDFNWVRLGPAVKKNYLYKLLYLYENFIFFVSYNTQHNENTNGNVCNLAKIEITN